MTGDRRAARRRAYLSLGWGELAAAVVFAGTALIVVAPLLDGPRERLALAAALVPLLVVLAQAGGYWLLARAWVGLRPMPARTAAAYRAFAVLDLALLAAGLVGVVVWLPEAPPRALAVTGIWLFGVVEFLNYFVVRLAYPVGSWFRLVRQWRTPQLVRDVRSAR